MTDKPISEAASRELEIELLRRKITDQEQAFHRALQTVADIHESQLGRMRELGIQETLLKNSNQNEN